MKLQVIYIIDGTVHKDVIECTKKPSMQIFSDGRGKVIIDDGVVGQTVIIYRDVQRIKLSGGSTNE